MSVTPGTRLGAYEIAALVGAGGMGEVYRAVDTRLGRAVALKILTEGDPPDARSRLTHEARAIATLNHPHICTLYDVSSDGATDFIVMEWLEGETLADRLSRGPLTLADTLRYAIEIGDALACAHRAGLTHRDLKPSNVMLTGGGTKLLDFGIATRSRIVAADRTRTASAVLLAGTPAYMAPERWTGAAADARADVWALGVVIFEMLTAAHPFFADKASVTPFTPVPDRPRSLSAICPETPAAVTRTVDRALQRDPAARYDSADAMLRDLRDCKRELDQMPQPSLARRFARELRRPAVAPIVLLLLAAIVLAGMWWSRRNALIRDAREQLPELTRLAEAERYAEAFALAQKLEQAIPNDPVLETAWKSISTTGAITTRPPGVDLYFKPYADVAGSWIHLGLTPIEHARLPNGLLRIRAEKPGYTPLLVARTAAMLFAGVKAGRVDVKDGLDLESDTAPPEMVRVPATRGYSPVLFHGLPPMPLVDIPAFWLDKYEVTNREYRKFVIAGGYTRPEFWQEPAVKNGRRVPWQELVRGFVDRTGRPGPSTWELGDYPTGQDDFPVSGVSWYEAAAYASFAGKQLPTLYHWIRGASTNRTQDMLPLSNVPTAARRPGGPVRVGSTPGVSIWGAFEMAGNVKEWCANATEDGRRIVLGGAWDEPDYMFHTKDARDPLDRSADIGFRCARYSREGLSSIALSWAPTPPRSYAGLKPVSEDVFEIYRGLYAYDPTPPNGNVESLENDKPNGWRMERVTYSGPGDTEHLPAYVFVPANGSPPYQAIVFFPGSTATTIRSSRQAVPGPEVTFLVKSGRAVIYPVYAGTYERSTERSFLESAPSDSAVYRDAEIERSKEVRRAVDYLVSRPDIDRDRISYYGFSWGAAIGPLSLALEPRFRTAVLVSGGLLWVNPRPEVDVVNFLPRVRIPILMLNGEHDSFYTPVAQQTFFNLLGTPAAQKRHVVYPGAGHVVPRFFAISETLAWLDSHLGRVQRTTR